jgi:hypothetical protein
VLTPASQTDFNFGLELIGTQSQPTVHQSVGHSGGDLRVPNVLPHGTNRAGSAETYLSGRAPSARDALDRSLFPFEGRSERRKWARALESPQARMPLLSLGFSL